MNSQHRFSLMVHGGSGAFGNFKDHEMAGFLESLKEILEQGRGILQQGGAAIEAVEACASLLEDDPLFNAGRGSVLNEAGRVEMDAAIMDGRDLSAGAVAAITGIANPVQLARRVLQESGHVMLIGAGAMQFAEQSGIPRVHDDYFLTPERVEELKKVQQQHRKSQHGEESGEDGVVEAKGSEDSATQEYGTIGAVARDLQGNLAAATSTGGLVNKRSGRVGDSPLIGAGLYADNQSCAASASGQGEDFMRTVLCKMIADLILMQGLDADHATRAGIEYFGQRIQGQGGVIVIDRDGHCASGFTTRKMIRGWIEHAGETNLRF
ncbi:MAG: isoaspartyl peptidase/L-asparaginase family protein [Methylococcales bacterium]